MNVAAWQKYVEASNAYIKKLERRLKQMNSQKQDFQRRIDHLQKNLKVADEVVDIVGYVVLISPPQPSHPTTSYSHQFVHTTDTHVFCRERNMI